MTIDHLFRNPQGGSFCKENSKISSDRTIKSLQGSFLVDVVFGAAFVGITAFCILFGKTIMTTYPGWGYLFYVVSAAAGGTSLIGFGKAALVFKKLFF